MPLGIKKQFLDFSVSLLHVYSWPWRGVPWWSLSVLFPHVYLGLREWATARRGKNLSFLGLSILAAICLSVRQTEKEWTFSFSLYVSHVSFSLYIIWVAVQTVFIYDIPYTDRSIIALSCSSNDAPVSIRCLCLIVNYNSVLTLKKKHYSTVFKHDEIRWNWSLFSSLLKFIFSNHRIMPFSWIHNSKLYKLGILVPSKVYW